MKMPFTPSRIKRSRMYGGSPGGRRGSYGGQLATAMRASKLLRSIGAPALAHTFARPGNIMRVWHNGTNYVLNGNVITPGALGLNVGSTGTGYIQGTQYVGLSQFFQYSFLQNFGDLSGMYDNYRIKAVKLRIDFSANTAPGGTMPGVGGSGIVSLPMIHYCVDPDDSAPPTAETDVLQYSKSRSVRLGDKPIYINLVPRANGDVATAANPAPGTAASIGTMLPLSTWLDTSNAREVPHYGIKYWIEQLPTGIAGAVTNWLMTFTPVYILECKNIH